jgi:hypothetical protein
MLRKRAIPFEEICPMTIAPKTSTSAPKSSDPPAAQVEAASPETQPDPPVRTAADEQRERSQDIQDKGVEAVKAAHDERDPKDRPQAVAGVGKAAP